MLNIFKSEPSIHQTAEDSNPRKNLSDARKRLRWLITTPPENGAKRLTIDSDLAEAMLERNQDDEWKNRPHSEKGLLRYVRNMQRGWKYTGETIIFSVSGHLLNGQHRLMACIKAGCSFDCLVAFGVPDDAFKFMDTGIARTAAHIFAIEEVPNANQVAAAARLLYGYKQRVTWDGRAPEVENDVLLEFYRHHERLQDSLTYGRQLYSDIRVPLRWGTFLHYVCAEKNRNQADKFYDILSTGIGIESKSSPLFKLRKRLQEDAMSTSTKLGDSHLGAFIIKGWNAHRRGDGITLLKWRTEQSANESFPRAE